MESFIRQINIAQQLNGEYSLSPTKPSAAGWRWMYEEELQDTGPAIAVATEAKPVYIHASIRQQKAGE